MGKFNIVNFRRDSRNAKLRFGGIARNAALTRFTSAKDKLLNDFDEHPVTIEIEGGVDAENISGTLGGRPNLWGFIGFPIGDTPIKGLRAALYKFIKMEQSPKIQERGDLIFFSFKVDVPSLDDLAQITPLPFEPGSWLIGIEIGISGLTRYIYWRLDNENSRSGRGLQAKNELRSINFKPVDYVSKMLTDFKNKFSEDIFDSRLR